MKLRFTIRDLLWLAVVVALSVGWWVDHGNRRAMQNTISNLRSELEKSYTVNALTGERPPDPEVERVLREAGSDLDKIRPPEKQAKTKR